MRKVLLIAMVLVTSLGAMAQEKFGHIDSNELLKMMPERAAAEEKVKAFQQDLVKKLEAMQAEYQNKYQEFMDNQDGMTQTERDAKTRDILDLEQRIQQFQVKAQEDIQKQEQELLAPMIDRAKNAIEKVGKENGFTYIFDSSVGVILYEGGEDIMPKVKKELGLQ